MIPKTTAKWIREHGVDLPEVADWTWEAPR